MRVTQQLLQIKVARLNKYLGRSEAQWTRDASGKRSANVGSLLIDAYSPGDGVTRYRLAEMCENGGINTLQSVPCLGAREFYTYLDGVETGILLQRVLQQSGD
jgi:hypothetical protein